MVIATKSFAGLSQNTNDTLCFPTEVIRKVLVAAEQKKVLEERVIILGQRIEGLEKSLQYVEAKDSVTVATYERQIKEMKEQQQILLDTVASLNKEIRREKRRRFFTGLAGTVTTAGALFLLLTKK